MILLRAESFFGLDIIGDNLVQGVKGDELNGPTMALWASSVWRNSSMCCLKWSPEGWLWSMETGGLLLL